MKCILVREVGAFELASRPVRRPHAGEVLVKVEVAGLCRTDLKIIRSGHRDLLLPRIPGEEAVGIIEERGREVRDTLEGARVYLYPGISCGVCRYCLKGAGNLCRDMQIMGFQRDGGFAQYVTVPAASVIPVPRGLPADLAVFAEPLSCCLNALELARVTPGDAVAVWGAGPAGALLCRAASALGAESASIESDPRRRALMGGSSSCPDTLFDVCIVAVGSREAYTEALSRLGPRGRLIVFSGLLPIGEGATLAVDFNQLHYHEQSITGAYGCSRRHGAEALALIDSGRVAVRDLISHRFPLERLDEALDIVENRSGMKVLLYPEGGHSTHVDR